MDAPPPVESPEWGRAVAAACADPGRVGLAFQPIVDLNRGTVAGYEVLARPAGPPATSPDRWFAAAGHHGMADAFEAAVLSRTLGARAATPPNCFLSINVSPDALVRDEVQTLFDGVDRLDATVIEVTEQAAVDDYDLLEDALDRLRAKGALIAVDDAGAGYASLSHVTRLRPSFVKLDRGLVTDCDTDPAKFAALEMLGTLAGRIDAWVVGEGLERRGELDALLVAGVPLGQGYHLARPGAEMAGIDAEAREDLVARHAERTRIGGVSGLLERAPAVPERAPVAAPTAFLADPRLQTVVVVDERSRPVGLVRRDEDKRVREPRPVLTADPAEAPRDLVLRALTRPPWRRFDPVVCCDGRGRYLGLVSMERLVTAVAG